MIGHELGGRYEVIERIGGGGMALVYKAHDSLLGRKVAVKILRQQYTNDEDFIKRFRREAQAAASLSHPNVVSIYDVGQEGDIHYIIMEYVDGANLNDRIKQKAPLQIEEAVHIASQICDALDHAHQNQIIHRDIKPHNILIGKNGRVKVTDFGIARAASAMDITQTGAVLGSVHYFSPEHAKGVQQGAKSDLYSLGIVLYQMLTARLPFLGDSPISVALKHLQEKVEEPRKVNPLIPQSVENIILKALRKNPEERYSSAKQMLADLESCLLPARRDEPKLQLSPEDEGDNENTLIMPAIKPDKSFDSAEKIHSGRSGETVRWSGLEDEPDRGHKAWIKPVVWIIVVFALLGAMWYGIAWLKNKMEVPEVEVPNVVGLTLVDAIAALSDKGLDISEPEFRSSDEYDKDTVIGQDKAGEIVKQTALVHLVVSSGPVLLEMADYVGDELEEVENELTALKAQGVTYRIEELNDDEPKGIVIGQTPEAGESYNPKETELVIQVSKGKGTILMPEVTNMKIVVAKSILERKGLAYKEVHEKTYATKDVVFKQWPYLKDEPVDPSDPNTVITLYVSDGLPDEAAEDLLSVTVPPTADGEATQVQIMVSDAYGDNVLKVDKSITEDTPFTIQMVLSPQRNGVVTIKRNGELFNTITRTYEEAKNGMNPERDTVDSTAEAKADAQGNETGTAAQ